MPFASASDGARIFYRMAGDGPPLLLSNASFATHLHWAGNEAALAKRFRVISWDYRGHGRSDAPAEESRYSLAQVVEDLRCVHEAAAGGVPAIAGGLSIGGLVSLRYALTHPERVRALVLINTGPGFKNPEGAAAWHAMLERAASKMQKVGLEAYLAGSRAQAELLGLHPGSEPARRALEGILTSTVPGLLRFARQVAGPVPNLIDELARIEVPALVLAGEQDAAFERASQVMAAKLPRARRLVIAAAGHMLNLDQPAAFVRAIEDFESELPALPPL